MMSAPNRTHPTVFHRLITAVLCAVVIILAVVLTTAAMQANRMLPGTSINGFDVSGLTRQAARQQLRLVADDFTAHPATLTLSDETHTLLGVDAAVRVDVPATIDAAYHQGRTSVWSVMTRPYHLFTLKPIPFRFAYDPHVVAAFVALVASTHDQPLVDGAFTVTATRPFVHVQRPQVGVRVDTTALHERTVALLTGAADSPQPVPVVVETPRLSVPHTMHLFNALTTVFATPHNIAIETSVLSFAPAQLAALLKLVEEPARDGSVIPRVVIDPARLPQRLIDTAARHTRDPEPARFLSPSRPKRFVTALGDLSVEPLPAQTQIIPARDGLQVDVHALAEQLAVAVSNAQPHIRLKLRAVAPPVLAQPLETLRPTHLLATFTSPLIAGQARNTNIELLAQTLDGRVILPGQSFSINAISGQRRCEDGYVLAGIIFDGELIEACGGGVSQVGTTFLNAAWFAGMQLDAFTPHSFYIGRYAPGREATLSYPRLDVAFTNTTTAAVHIRTFTTPTSLTVSLYGKPAFAQVRALHGLRLDPRPFTEERRLDPKLPPGSEEVRQAGGPGFRIIVTRIMTTANGSEQTEQFTTRYLPQRRIVAFNPDVTTPPPLPLPPPPPPDDAPDDTSDDESATIPLAHLAVTVLP